MRTAHLFNFGLIAKSMREVRFSMLFFALGLATFEGLLAGAIPTLFSRYEGALKQFEIFGNIVAGLLGTQVGDLFGKEAFHAFSLVHPLILALVWTHAIWHFSRIPAGEIDRGTVDLLLSLPSPRWRVLLCDSVVGVSAGLTLCLVAVAAHLFGSSIVLNDFGDSWSPALLIGVNMMCMHFAVAGITTLFSCFSERRGRAVGATLAVVLGSFLVNFLGQFWEPAKAFRFLSVLEYYQPFDIWKRGVPDWSNLGVLLAIGVVSWLLGAWIFDRRDIHVT